MQTLHDLGLSAGYNGVIHPDVRKIFVTPDAVVSAAARQNLLNTPLSSLGYANILKLIGGEHPGLFGGDNSAHVGSSTNQLNLQATLLNLLNNKLKLAALGNNYHNLVRDRTNYLNSVLGSNAGGLSLLGTSCGLLGRSCISNEEHADTRETQPHPDVAKVKIAKHLHQLMNDLAALKKITIKRCKLIAFSSFVSC